MTIASLILKRMDSLTSSEKKVARSILAQYPVAGLETMARLGERAKVSDPTVIRFINKLGFKRYNDFQDALRHEIHDRMQSPTTLTPVHISSSEKEQADRYSLFSETLGKNLTETINSIPTSEIQSIADLLKDTKRRIYIIGGEFTSSAASHLYFQLRKMRRGIIYIDDQVPARTSYLLDINKKDILFVFDVRRYQKDVIAFASMVSKYGCKILLVTDQWLSPIAKFSTHVLPCKIDSYSRWDSLVSMIAVIELLIYIYMEEEWDNIKSRLEDLDNSKDQMDKKIEYF